MKTYKVFVIFYKAHVSCNARKFYCGHNLFHGNLVVMCLAIPAKITRILENQKAIVNVGGIEREISIALLEPDNIAVNDYVIIHVGYALTRLDEKEAQKTFALFAQMGKS